MTTDLKLSYSPEVDQLKYADQRDIMCMTTMKAPEGTDNQEEEDEKRAPIDLICVIDRSGSMAGKKLNLVKEALLFVVDQLRPKDRLSIVTFDTQVNLEFSLTSMNNQKKQTSQDAIRKITAGSCTNLSGGIFKGFEVVKSRKEKNEVVSLLVFTDGIANVGLTETSQLMNAVEKIKAEIGTACSLFTFGFGADHSAEMLKSVAESGNGLYYYISKEEEIPESFANCLGGLCSVAAQNITMSLSVPEEAYKQGVQLKNVQTKYKWTTIEANKKIEISMGDIYSDESRDVVFNLHLPSLKEPCDVSKVIKVDLSYFNVLSTNLASGSLVGTIKRPKDIEGKLQVNIELDRQRNRITSVGAIEQAKNMANIGKLEEARKILDEAIKKIRSSVTGTTEFSLALIEDMETCKSQMVDRNQYQAVGSKLMENMYHGIAYQRNVSSNSKAQVSYMNKGKSKKMAFFKK